MKYGPIAYYEVRWRPVDGLEEWVVQSYPADTTQITIKGVHKGESYYIEARSVGPTGLKSVWVDISHTVDGNLVPEGPGTLTAIGLADGVRLSWTLVNEPSPNIVFCVERSTNGVSGWVEKLRTKSMYATMAEKVDGTFYYRMRSYVSPDTYSAYTAVVSGSPATVANLQGQISASQTDATNALNGLSDISNDNLLTPAEKKIVIKDQAAISNEQAGIDAKADSFGNVTEKAAYDNAITALNSYLATLTSPTLWSSMSGNTTIVRNTFKQKFLDVYSTRQALLNAIYQQAKYIADGKVAASGANLIPNPTYVLNNYGVTDNVGLFDNDDVADGWMVDPATDSANAVIRNYSGTTGILTQVGNPSMATGTNSYAAIRTKEKIPVDASCNYLVDCDYTQSYNGTMNSGFTAISRVVIQWYTAAGGGAGSTVAISVARAGPAPNAVIVTSPATARYCAVQVYTQVVNSSGATNTPLSSGTIVLRTTWNWVSLVKQVPTTAYLPMLMYGNGRAKVPTVITYSASAGSPASATINVAAFSIISGSRTISYNAMSVNLTHAAGTVQYYLYCDDPNATGGSKTLVATTNGDAVYQSEGRLYIGDVSVTYPASGTSSGGGGRLDSCVCIDMFLHEDILAVEAREGMILDCLDLPTSDLKFKRRIRAVRFTEEECVEIKTDGGAVLRLSCTTPFDLLDRRVKFADEMLGELVVTDKGIEQVVYCEPIGKQPVARISVGGVSYAAGEDSTHRIYSHNALKP